MRVDEGTASCLLYSFKEGLLSAVAHDLEIRVTRFSVTIDGAAGSPRSISASFDAGSLRVVSAMKDGVARPSLLGDGDRRTIEATIKDSVLQSKRWPVVRYEVAGLTGVDEWLTAPGAPLRLDGRLKLCGVERPLACVVQSESGVCVTEVDIQQPDFGIKPYSAALGTLRVKPQLRVRVAIPIAALSAAGEPAPLVKIRAGSGEISAGSTYGLSALVIVARPGSLMRLSCSLFVIAAALIGGARPAQAQTPYPWSDGVRPVAPGPGGPPQGYPPQPYPPQGGYPQQPYPQGGYPQPPYPPRYPQQPYPPQPPPSGWRPMGQGQGGSAMAAPPPSSSSSKKSDSGVGVTGVLGLYGGQWNQRGAPSDDKTAAFGVQIMGDLHALAGEVTVYGSATLSLGGSYGFEQRESGYLMVGWRPPVADEHGPVLRAGVSADRWKSDRLFFKQLSLPVAEVGYQYASDHILIEAVGLGGGVLYGQLTVGNDGGRDQIDSGEIDHIDSSVQTNVRSARALGTAGELGAAFRLRTDWFGLSVQGQRIYVQATDGGPVDTARGMACANPIRQLTMCVDGMFLHSALRRDDSQRLQDTVATYIGLTLGVGITEQR